MGRLLYVAENPYVMYKIIIKVFLNHKEKSDIIIADNIESLLPLAKVIEEMELFHNVFLYRYDKNDKYHTMHVERGKNIVTAFLFFLKRYGGATLQQKQLKNDEQLRSIDFSVYDEIYTSDFDVSRINGYLAVNKIPYTLMEHAKYVFDEKNIGIVYNMATYVAGFLERLHLVTGIRIASKYCEAVEVHDGKNLGKCLKLKQIKVWDVDKAISQLNAKERDAIYQVYSKAYGLDLDSTKKYNLLLTNPLALDEVVDGMEAQMEFYRRVRNVYLEEEYPLIVKPHPRDKCDYGKVFPDAVIVNKDISSEIMKFNSGLKLHKAFTFYSTSVEAFKEKADKVEYISPSEPEARQSDFLMKFNEEWRG